MRDLLACAVALGQVCSLHSYDNRNLFRCIVWNAHNTVIGLKRSDICAQVVYFQSCTRRGLVSRDSIVDGDWLPATD